MTTTSITYRKPGTQPPIYVAGTFSDPPWEAYEMEYTTDADGEHTFTKDVTVEPGSKIQYKFRVGKGDWWVLLDGKPTDTDESGNTNHILEVQPAADGHAMKDNESKEPSNKIREGLAKHILGSHSGASTPTYARVAAEVADSAALLNIEKPETPVPDDLAGKIGYRRLTSTPIAEVASTAAEVADTARELDIVEPAFKMFPDGDPTFARLDSDPTLADDEDEPIDQQPPLFAHEALGIFGNVDSGGDAVGDSRRGSREPEVEDIDPDDIDLNDPTLERFPSNREAILDTVRKLETGLDEDQASFDGAPLSPVVVRSRRGTDDDAGDVVLSPIPVSPGVPRPARRLDAARSPRASIGSAHSSTASLQAIHEAEETGPEEETRAPHVVRLSTPRGRSPLRNTFKSPGSDEDEGVVIQDGASPKARNGRLLTPDDAESAAQGSTRLSPQGSDKNDTIPSENVNGAPKSIDTQTSQISAPNGAQKSPRIVVDGPEGEGTTGDGVAEGSSSIAVDRSTNGSTTRLRKAGDGQVEQPAIRRSVPSAAIPAEHEGGWIKAFFRLLFVDLIGGFISRLCGGRRKTT